MIKPTELRKGNIVQYGVEEQIFLTVQSISETGINGKWHDDEDMIAEGRGHGISFEEYPFQDIDPVALTPEIPGKCGFADDKNSNPNGYNELKCKHVTITKADYAAVYKGEWLRKLNYLHQLQNLYFALTCEELDTTAFQNQ